MIACPGWRVCARVVPAWPAWAAAMVLAGAVPLSYAQQSPWRPARAVEIVVPTAPGGAVDLTARLMQRILEGNRIIDVPVVIINRPGGGQTIAMNYLDQHVGDGHYLLNSTMSVMTSHILGRSKVNYTDYTPVAVLFGEAMTLMVRTDSPLKSGRDIQQRLKSDPKSLSVAIGIAIGGTNHLAVGLVMGAMGIDVKQLKTVVFPANSNALTALMGGHVDLLSMSVAAAANAVQDGKLRIIGITSARRGEGVLAGIPTWKEQGWDVVFTNTRFMLGPNGMSPAQTAYWDAAIERMVQSGEWKNDLQKNYLESDYLGSKQSPQRLAEIYKQLRGALVDAGLAKE